MNVIFLSYANSHQSPLPTLQKEDDAVFKALAPGALKQHFLLHRDSFATIDKIAEYLTLYRNHIYLFHFGGHAGRDALLLDKEKAHGQGIAHLLGQCAKLQLVVLNGCSTEDQVEQLLDNGVPVVIATSAMVGDEKASQFAAMFYQALAQQATISDAFELALGKILTIDPNVKEEVSRGLDFKSKTGKPIWGIFYREENKDVLERKLPQQVIQPVPSDFKPNSYLIDTLWASLRDFSPNLAGKKKVSLARKRMAILNSLPAPIAEHLRKLMVPVGEDKKGFDKVSMVRLEQIARTYRTVMELLAYTVLAQLWEIRLEKGSLKLPAPRTKEILDFLNLKQETQEVYDYVNLIRQVQGVIEKNDGTYFVEELGELKEMLYKEGPFQSASFFLEILRVNLVKGTIEQGEVQELCIRAEESLAAILASLGFLTKYALVAIQNIDVIKYRHTPKALFKHMAVILRDLLGGLEVTPLEFEERFMDNRSIVLFDEETEQFLNLTPFIIDANAFIEEKTDVAKIYFLSHYNRAGNAYCFKYVYKPDDESALLLTSAKGLDIVKIQLDAFKEIIRTE